MTARLALLPAPEGLRPTRSGTAARAPARERLRSRIAQSMGIK
jgi:hypothetical protein